MTAAAQPLAHEIAPATVPSFPLDQWYVAALSWELKDQPIGRTLLNKPVVLFRTSDNQVAALEDRCCHRALPLSGGTVEERGLRCGYHGLLFNEGGKCIEIPGQDKIPSKAKVPAYPVREQDQIIWIWFGSAEHPEPTFAPTTCTAAVNTCSTVMSTTTTRPINSSTTTSWISVTWAMSICTPLAATPAFT